ncbi:MAG: signal peptidase I [Minisyncoccia bacterium]
MQLSDRDGITTRAREGEKSSILQLLKFTILALLIITPFRFFVAQPFIVSGASMEPTIDPHEYLVIDQVTYRFEKPARGDVIIFRYPLDPAIFFVKRVIGLPGERIDIEDGSVRIWSAEGVEHILTEPYAREGGATGRDDSITLDTDEYFVLGDNRAESSDSRTWGPVQESYIVGRALARLFPFKEAGIFPGAYSFPDDE